MRIREVTGDDFSAIAEITNHYIATSTIHFAYEPVTADELRAAHEARYPYFVAADGGRVVAYAKAGAWRARAAYAWTAETGVYVAHDACGRGFGRAVYTAMLDECARRGFRSVVAGVTLPNDASIAMHLALGFESVGVFRDAGWKHGVWCDVAWYQKRFATDASGPHS